MTQFTIVPHIPVMLNEVLSYLKPNEGEIFLDCTFGAGGYSEAILANADCKLVAIDRDPSVMQYVDVLQNKYGERFKFHQGEFANIANIVQGKKFNGIVADFGVSSMQLDDAERGFSFNKDGILDMRMGSCGMSAGEFVNSASEEKIADVIYYYGDETAARRIAKQIVLARRISPIATTLELAQIIYRAKGTRGKYGQIDNATKTFQAIRIFINEELEQIRSLLNSVLDLLLPGGRLVAVSFHSLEDVIVKNFIRDNAPLRQAKSKYAKHNNTARDDKPLLCLTKKPLIPSAEEIFNNPRSRSAKLRVALKI